MNMLALSRFLLWRTVPFACVVLLNLPQAGCGQPDTLTLLDSRSRVPVPGALIFSPGDKEVYRSDVNGIAVLPPGYGKSGLTIHAKNFQPRELELSDTGGDILLVYDETLVNPREAQMVFERADTLRGSYGPFRQNNDVLTYDLDIKVDVAEKFLRGTNKIRFAMIEDADRIQLDLFENMNIDSIVYHDGALPYTREFNAVFIDFPETLRRGETYSIDFHYSGHPEESGRFGGFAFREDSLGNPWVFTACQGIGASLWWPNKDQQPDEVDSMTISITVPSALTDVSNGRLVSAEELGDGTTKYRWKVHYPINNYSVAVNVADYAHFSDTLGPLTLDYYVLPYHLADARRQFAQVKPMLQCFNERFGEYPFPRDGYKLVEVPYAGMEHQSAVAYGNGFQNGYLARDWTGVGISLLFDFIIVHETAHEWFGNSVTANDVSDAWIHEGWGTYLEGVYVECLFGYDDALTYLNGYKGKVGNLEPIIGPTGVNHWPTQDQYFKGALFLNTLRHVVDDDEAWWALLREYAEHFKYQNVWTTDVINFFNARLDRDLRPVFEQYLYYPELPVLQVRSEGASVSYRWQADVNDFDMPLKVRFDGSVHTVHPTSEWQSEPLNGGEMEAWQPATDLFYIEVQVLR
ncbi:MAG: M1 family metallopeptidase [Gemmatimonadota bacterium]|nr:MAG: M1 family metallopeptidase [Gemmatimonadota bacterium]